MDPFRVTFVTLLLLMFVVRMFWHLRAEIHRPGRDNPSEGAWVPWGRRLVLPLFLAAMVAWLYEPSLLPWANLPFPDAARWAGVPVFALGLGLLIWVHATLDRNFSPYLRIRDDHTLVTSGPYRWVRHPMYTAFLLLMAGLCLVSAHLLMLVSGFGLLLAIVQFRTPREEAMLIGAFGEDYRAYIARTGALLPRLGRQAS
jgi:protein-S-isoprenylcysteine O-methyltransferase Ste14